jgi:hypothetical protein
VVEISEPGSLSTDLNGSLLNLTPTADFFGELDVTVRGTDSSGLFRDGDIRVVVQPVNDAPVIRTIDPISAQAKVTIQVDLTDKISDIDNTAGELTVTVNSSFITVSGMLLYATFDQQGTFTVNLTVTDGALPTSADISFEVTPAEGWPSITGLPSIILVHINRALPMDMTQFGSDPEDNPGELTWAIFEDSNLFDAVLDEGGFNLTITPTGTDMGIGVLRLTLTDTDDHSVTVNVDVNITERLIEAPRINHETLPSSMKLKKEGDGEVIDLRDHVEDDTPAPQLTVVVTYSKEDVVYVDVQDGILTFVPQAKGRTQVTVVLTDTDDRSSEFSVDVEVTEEGSDDEINWTPWLILLFILAIIVILLLWPRKGPAEGTTVAPKGAAPVVDRPRITKVKPHMFRSSSLRRLEEMLLFHSDGMLVSQYTRAIKEGLDADLESGPGRSPPTSSSLRVCRW